MNFSKKNHNLVDQNEKTVKKSQKHDANLQKNSTLYFQVGLILTLLATYGLLEMEFQINILPETTYTVDDDEPFILDAIAIAEVPKPIEKMIKPQKRKLIIKEPIIVKDDVVIPKADDSFITEPISTPVAPVLDPGDIDVPDEPKFVADNVLGVELVPIYPGCEGLSSNNERLDCMSKKLNKLVGRKFDSDIVSDIGVTKDQRIYVNFKIDKTGQITDIKARSSYAKLKREAIKVANKIPQMTPAKQSNKNVEVMYTLPIMIKVKNN